MIKRKTYTFRSKQVIEVEEFHDGNYGAPGGNRTKKKKPTKEQMQLVNRLNKAKRCRMRMLEYFKAGDVLATWTYEVQNRPPDMAAALKDFQRAMRKVRQEYKKQGEELYWIRNIEKGTRGAWHIHLLINEIGDTASIIQKAWTKGGTWFNTIQRSRLYSADMSQLADYMTKDENFRERKKDNFLGKTRIAESNYNTSRNMPLPEPKVDKLFRWKKSPKPKKGYYIAKIYEGINPVTGYKYRRYTQIRLVRRE